MRRLLVVVVAALFVGCTSKTEFGPCIGAFDEKDPALRYKANGWNIAMGIVFFEFLIPPVIVVVDEFQCPTGKKAP